jgi:Zn-dependent protease with chaperone function
MASFFENQHLARRNTKLLVLMYVLAVIGVIFAVDLVLAGLYAWSIDLPPQMQHLGLAARLKIVPTAIYVLGGLATAVVILAVSGWNMTQLSSGGKAVAEMVGARRIPPDTGDPLERRLVNVVEEMSIASGVRVPAVYVMDGEQGINAFAAGYEVSDSILAVTRGTLETLNRDELQGVIGHEFSHILNGDMRLNIRMIGVLAGIVFIGSAGNFLLRSLRGGSDNKGAAPIFAAGLALMLIGYIGLFFARLIKAAVSRQREFLADASSVQFTRNPDGIAGALDQIEVSATGALIANRRAEDLSHMFFGQGIRVVLSGLFDTHPPLEERIARVNARFERASYRKRRASARLERGCTGGATGRCRAPFWRPGRNSRAARRGRAQAGRSAGGARLVSGQRQSGLRGAAFAGAAARLRELRDRMAPRGDGDRTAARAREVRSCSSARSRGKGMGALGAGGIASRRDASGGVPAVNRPGAAGAIKVGSGRKKKLVAALVGAICADQRVSCMNWVLTLVHSQTALSKPSPSRQQLAAAGRR